MNVRRMALPLLLLVGAVVFFVMFAKGGKGAKRPGEEKQVATKSILVAKTAVAQGQKLDADVIESKSLPEDQYAKEVPADAFTDAKLLVGGTAKVALAPGDYFTPNNVLAAPSQLSQKIEPGFVGVTIPAPPAPSLYDLAFLNPDDRVDVFGVSADAATKDTVTVRLAGNVRLLARDDIISMEQHEAWVKEQEAKIAQLQADRQKAASGTPPASADTLKASYDDPIAAIKEDLAKKPENPSITLEVTPAQSQAIALWRQTADISIALHREEDAQQIIFDTSMAFLDTGAGTGEGGQPRPAAGKILTLDDVVPLKDRDPQKNLDWQRRVQEQKESVLDEKVTALERQVRAKELQVQLKNLNRYGSIAAPPPRPATVSVPPVMPQVRTAATEAQIRALKREIELLKKTGVQPPRVGQPGGTRQQPPSRTIEIYRGKEKTVYSY